MDLPEAFRQAASLQPGREGVVGFVIFTRPDDSTVGIDPAKVMSFAPVPPLSSPLAGPIGEGTRIVFINKTHQDVKELVDEVARRFKAAASEAIKAMMVKGPRTISIETATRPATLRPVAKSGGRARTG
jgi:hypothetical protein